MYTNTLVVNDCAVRARGRSWTFVIDLVPVAEDQHGMMHRYALDSHNNGILGFLLGDQATAHQELLDLQSLIALELENLSKIVGLGSRRGRVFIVGIR